MGFRSRSRTISTLPASRRRPQARSTADYVQARRELALTRRAITETFAEVDLLITPTAPAFPETIASAESAVGGGADAIPPGRNTLPFNLYGIPTISVPCGFGRSGLPIGLQISVPRSARSTCSHSPTPTSA